MCWCLFLLLPLCRRFFLFFFSFAFSPCFFHGTEPCLVVPSKHTINSTNLGECESTRPCAEVMPDPMRLCQFGLTDRVNHPHWKAHRTFVNHSVAVPMRAGSASTPCRSIGFCGHGSMFEKAPDLGLADDGSEALECIVGLYINVCPLYRYRCINAKLVF